MALQHCVANYVEEIEPKRPEKPPKPAPQPAAVKDMNLDLQPIAYYLQLETKTSAEVLGNARRVLADVAQVQAKREPAELPTGSRSLYQLWKKAKKDGETVAARSGKDAAVADPRQTVPVPQSRDPEVAPRTGSR
jgi:hypothetical protein